MVTGLIVIAGGILLVRLGWGRRRDVAALGWVAAAVSLTALTLQDGAWGCAIGTLAGITAALAAVLYAGAVAPVGSPRAPRGMPAVAIPQRRAEIARAAAVFMLVVPLAFAATAWCAFGVQALARRGGMGEADAIVLTLFLQPMLWGAIMTIQMTRSGPARMIAAPAVAALLGTILWSAS